ncbi:MAG: hypothetical protein FJ161_04245 [Gammaproteobacteria bacterium]|nr:hypothetical protein [Gammaproteobacteria bacterium]
MTSENPWYCQVDTNSITSALDQTDRTLNTEELREFIAQNMRVSSLGSHPARMSCTTLSTTHSNLERKTDTLSHLRQQGYRFANLNPLYPKDLRADDINLKEFLDLPEAKLYLETCSLQAETLPEAVQDWCYQTYENIRKNALSEEEKESILKILCASEALELDLSARYPGAKRFSLSGLDSFLVILQVLFKDGHCQNGIAEYVLGLAHRGRLNVLMTLLGKSPKELFGCFEGIALEPEISGDVKYHRGYSSDLFMTEDSKIHAYVEYNPSHLEAVGPVATGHVRAQIDAGKCSKSSICGIIVHGDSAISGQGVVMETMNMSQTRGYGVGGTIHIILNNQVGFTTSDEQDTRSTPLCSDIAKMFDIPVVHVNADDPKACTDAARFALAWREKFQKDCIIHLIGYRKYGHNESDEPAATQPEMYQHVRAHPGILKKWIENSGLETQAAESLKKAYREKLQQNESIGFFKSEPIEKWYNIPKKSIYPLCQEQSVSKVLEAIEHNVQSLELHPRVSKIYSDRISMLSGQIPLDWGCAELLAFGSIAQEGVPIRLSGQDSRRGTFFQRHIAAVDQRTNESKIIIEQLGEIKVINSLLSEMAVLGFEYGYSKARPAGLTLWEAQFGDFANGAQVIIDQFISAGEQKWGHFSGITMLLPHGYEGEGPEHSSDELSAIYNLPRKITFKFATPQHLYNISSYYDDRRTKQLNAL